MKKFLLTLIVTMLTCIGTWADGVVTLSPAPSGTLELNLTDDAGGKIIGVSSPAVAASQGNSQFSFVCYDENDDILSSQDIVECTPSFVWSTEGHTVKIIPHNVGVVKLQFVIKNPYSGDVDKSEIITVSVNNEQKIPATLSGVPASIRVGNSGTAVVNVDGFTAGDDYTVVFSSTDEDIIKVAADGTLTPVAAGNATIKAVVTPTTTGNATAFVAKTLEATVEVKGAITATWTGSIANTSIPLGIQTTQSSDYPQVSWSETVAGAITVYSVISEDETLVKGHYTLQDNKPTSLVLAGILGGTANVTVKAEYGVARWDGSKNVIDDPVATSIFTPTTDVTVNGVEGSLTLTPEGSITFTPEGNLIMDVSDANAVINVTPNWDDATGGVRNKVVSSNPSVAKAEFNNEGTQITIDPQDVVGTTTITVTSEWYKALNNPYSEEGTAVVTKTFTVTVKDKTKAEVLTFADGTTATNVDVAQGYSAKVGVLFETEDAQFTFTPNEKTSGITPTWDKAAKTISFVADADATVDATADFTLSSGDKSITVTAKVVAPTPVENVTITPAVITIAKGETATFTASTDGADQSVTWSVAEGSEAIATSEGNGVFRGTQHGTATIKATATNDVSNTATVKVTDVFPVELPQPAEKFYIGQTHDAAFSVPGVEENLYTITYNSSKPSVMTVDADGTLTAVSAGVSTLSVKVTPTQAGKDALWTEYTNMIEIIVSKPEYSLTLSPATSAVDLASAVDPIQLTPAVLLNGVAATDKVAGTDYAITYALESPFTGVSVDQNGLVSVATTAQYGVATIVATLTPLGADAGDFTGATAKATVTVSKSGAGATITKNTDGSFTLSIPTAGAFYGSGLSDNPTTVTYVGFDDNDAAATNIAEFKAATNVSIEGIASNADIQEFTHLVGGSSSTVTDLDMGALVLTEAVTTSSSSHSFMSSGGDSNFPNSEYYDHKLLNVINFVMPRPSLTATNGTIIPANFDYWFGKNNEPYIHSLVITEGWTEVGESAFNRNKIEKEHPENSLESLKLPSTLKYIRKDAFAWLQCPTVIFPADLEVIEEGAFSASPAALKDVFFTGRTAPRYVHKDAFGSDTQISNNAYNNPTDGTATRDNYKAQSGWECMLHYPSGLTASEKATYEDPSREYLLGKRIPTGVDPTYGWNSNSNMYKVTPAWNNSSIKMTELSGAGTYKIDNDESFEAGFRDLAVGTAYIWPSVQQFRAAYVIAQSGYHWDGTEMSDEEKDRIGIYSFVFAKGDATPHHNEEDWILPYKYEQNNWWTICLPFDMSVEKVQEVFGPDTELCLFSKVIRDTETGKLRLEFKRSVMNDSYAKGDDKGAGLKAHTPYMIRPAGVIEVEKEGEVFTLDGYRKVKGFEIKEGDAQGFTVVAQDSEGTPLEYQGHPWNYTFIGNYQENYYIPQYSYFLSWSKNNATHRYFFEQGTTRAFNPYTCVVRAYRGGEDNVVFFDGGKSSSAKFASFFGLAEDETNKIEDMEIVCGNRGNDKVYTINGQLVNGSVLAPGLYIKNGKKFIVK